MRSKTTMVSFIEYPISVRMAATTVSEISWLVSEKAPMIYSAGRFFDSTELRSLG